MRRIQELKLAAATSSVAKQTIVPLFEFAEVSLSEGLFAALARIPRRLKPGSVALAVQSATTSDVVPSWQIAVPPLTAPNGVSIVIPVIDQPEYTLLCLREVVATCAAGTYEIIVIDNASAASTRTALSGVAGLRVIRNERNVGFVDACNQGASCARGKWLVFLNNDTVPRAGWLDALIAAAAAPDVGAVGAKLLYPDGRLQEAGSIVWRDGSGWNYGHGESPDSPEYGYVREVDYCSGACLLVARDGFLELGGFDSRYAPAYYEDTDLCFRLRERGLRTVYQPNARVVHFRGITAGTDPGVGAKRFQAVNRAKFVKRHAVALRAQRPMDARRLRDACDRTTGRRLLLVDHLVPEPDHDSGSVRITAILTALRALGHRVTFLPDNAVASQPYTSTLQQLGVEVLFGAAASPTWVAGHAREFDVVVLCRARFALKYLAAVHQDDERPALIFDTVDLHHLRELRMAFHQRDAVGERHARDTRAIELAAMHASDRVWVTSTFEADALRAYPSLPPVDVISNVHDVRWNVPPFGWRRDLVFVGGFRHSPNEDAVLFFVAEILPLVNRALPDVRFIVAGSDVPRSVLALESCHVVVAGQVADLESLFDACRLSVAPLRYGAGVKGKIGQSLGWGVPVVTTSIGAEGMGLIDGEHALIADSPAAFAACVVQAYNDATLWERLSTNGRDHIRQHFSAEVARDKLAVVLDTLLPRSAVAI